MKTAVCSTPEVGIFFVLILETAADLRAALP
jgi:hypothetical protein